MAGEEGEGRVVVLVGGGEERCRFGLGGGGSGDGGWVGVSRVITTGRGWAGKEVFGTRWAGEGVQVDGVGAEMCVRGRRERRVLGRRRGPEHGV